MTTSDMDIDMQEQDPPATFHPFPRLPLELRILIWQLATEERALTIKKWEVEGRPYRDDEQNDTDYWHGYWSPTPVPAVTRTCLESRKYCSYRKSFTTDASPHYIWANFDFDIIHMGTGLIEYVVELPEGQKIRHLRIELDPKNQSDIESFYEGDSGKLCDFPKMERFDLLVFDGLTNWTQFLEEDRFGACPKEYTRIIDRKTGEWIDYETCGPYQDWMDNYIILSKAFGLHESSFSGESDPRGEKERVIDWKSKEWMDELIHSPDQEWTEKGKILSSRIGEEFVFTRVLEFEEDEEDRLEKMLKLEMPRPRIDVSYMH